MIRCLLNLKYAVCALVRLCLNGKSIIFTYRFMRNFRQPIRVQREMIRIRLADPPSSRSRDLMQFCTDGVEHGLQLQLTRTVCKFVAIEVGSNDQR